MAKKRKEKTKEEELDFKLPKFDEEKFLKRERRNIKTLFLSFLVGFVISLISFGFWNLLYGSGLRWELILLLGVFCAPWLKYLFLKLDIDLTDFGKKGWFGSYATYFFTWLIVLVILVNPPFHDEEAPIAEVVVLPGMQELGGTVSIVAYITDNVGVEKQGIDFTLRYPNGTSFSPEFSFENNIFRYTYKNPSNISGEYTFDLTATDVNGLKNIINRTFEYSEEALKIISSIFSDIRSGDVIAIKAAEKISSENFRVYYRISNGTEINVDRKDKNDKEKYETTAEYEGWSENSNVTVKFYAEVSHYFVNVDENFTNTVEDTVAYNFSTGSDSNIGTEPPLENNELSYSIPYPRGLPSTPGFEALVFIISLIIVVLIFKFRKKKKR
ncbi:MAG: hypothetical protein JSW60_04200 [Thermoplasmatales archaeon]|nr:MAG: hypothetical protein JSW60_04200 [Thermoplasmatales archaeon]